ncbi:hypothetical protein A3K69_01050 [Candidatus Bathyarchaeota archaeon RBG_16_57_9]|nr:MAG: hypothetical protein A3K69_01050 [Candidatus Bathyarchaeota archaeon RBG_16_57_9]
MFKNVVVDQTDVIRIIHVDDDSSQGDFLNYFLPVSDGTFTIRAVSNPSKVLDELRTNRYDCVVTDYQMPELNGIELAALIRKEFDIPIIIYTGQGSEEVAEAAFSVGIDDYLRKEMDPSHYQVLAKRIRSVVEKKRLDNLYRTVIEQSRDAFTILVDQKVVFANKATFDLVGVKNSEDLLGKNPFPILLTDNRKKAERRYHEALKQNSSPGFNEYKIRRKDGKEVSIEVSTSPVSYNGKPAVICFARDITEKLRLEAEKQETQDRLKALVETAPDGIVTVDLLGKITSVNKMFSELTGFKGEEILGENFLKIKTMQRAGVDELKNYLKMFSRVLRGQLPPPFEFKYQRKDGSLGWAEAHAGFINIQGKKEILAIVREVSERKRIEAEMEEYSKHLEGLMMQRSQNIINNDEQKVSDQIISILSEELNNPLNDLKEFMSMLQKSPEMVSELLPVMKTHVDKSLYILEKALSRVKDPYMSLTRVSIKELIQGTLELLDIPNTIKVTTKYRGEGPVIIDRSKMRCVLENLINNAVEAMPNGGRLLLSANASGNDLTIKVVDTGTGMKPDVSRKIFQPFFSTKNGGIGLGLYYCKKAVEKHGGNIEVTSKEDFGTSVTIRIPLNAADPLLQYSNIDVITNRQ